MINIFKRILNRENLVCILLILTTPVISASDIAESTPEVAKRPHWTIDIKMGKFTPSLEQWEAYYGEEDMQQFGIGMAYKFFRSLEFGLEFSYMKDKGVGQIPLSDEVAGSVTHQLFPLHAYVVYRAVFNEDQFLVPYAGVGYTQTYYRQSIEAQSSSRGDTGGHHYRYGVQILLDKVDPGNSSAMEIDHNVTNSYLTIEVQDFSAEVDGIELGGESLVLGFMFEF